MLSFVIPATPVAQPRHRSTKSGVQYIPKTHGIHAFKNAVKKAWVDLESAGLPDWYDKELEFRVDLAFFFPYGKEEWSGAYGRAPDCDNLAKGVCDALNGLAWRDDRLITDLRVKKRWCKDGFVMVIIYPDPGE